MRCDGLAIAACGLLAAACGTTSLKQAPPPDQPVPASEPRTEIAARVDLTPSRDCEEAFDLAVYQNRAIELIAWDERTGTCDGRRIDVRYLSRKIDRDGVVRTIRRHAERVTVLPTEDSHDNATK